ncbi:MAG: LacI family DNA-binding transcriptional regulator [Planctomycetota bacterium]
MTTLPQRRKNVSLRDVASLAGVGITTVSDIVNRQVEGKYPEHTRERVLQAVRQTGYTPSRAAQKLGGKRSKEVGVVLTRTFENPFFARLTHEIQKQLGRRGYRAQLHVTGKDLFLLSRFPVELLGDHVDGVVLGPVYESDREHLEALHAFEDAGIPVTLFGGSCGTAHAEFLWPHDAAGRLAADMLLDRGHRRILFLGSGVGSAKRRDGKVSGIEAAVEARGGMLDRVPHADTGDYEDFYQTAASFCRSWRSTPEAQRATAVICLNDQLAVSLYAACSDLNIAIPSDLSVVSFDNIPESVVLRPALSTIDFRAADQVQRIVDLMVCRIEGRDPNGSATPAEPIALVRDSVRPLRDDTPAPTGAPVSPHDRGS